MNYPIAAQRSIRCHAGLVADCRGSISYSQHDPASRLDFWIPTFIRLWRICRNDASPQAGGYEKENTNFVPLILPLSLRKGI